LRWIASTTARLYQTAPMIPNLSIDISKLLCCKSLGSFSSNDNSSRYGFGYFSSLRPCKNGGAAVSISSSHSQSHVRQIPPSDPATPFDPTRLLHSSYDLTSSASDESSKIKNTVSDFWQLVEHYHTTRTYRHVHSVCRSRLDHAHRSISLPPTEIRYQRG
jgi:hypothetical protein